MHRHNSIHVCKHAPSLANMATAAILTLPVKTQWTWLFLHCVIVFEMVAGQPALVAAADTAGRAGVVLGPLPCMIVAPAEISKLVEKSQAPLDYNVTCGGGSNGQPWLRRDMHLTIEVDDPSIVELLGDVALNITFDGTAQANQSYNLSVLARQFGYAKIYFKAYSIPVDDTAGAPSSSLLAATAATLATCKVTVIRGDDSLGLIFSIVLGVLIVLYNFGFGCKMKHELILVILKKPVAPALGFCCQFLIMAPVSYGIAMALQLSPQAGLGLLAIGSAPGGGGSNVFAYLLDADLELSITMSFISTLASLGMTTLWIWGLGRFFTDGSAHTVIPVANVFASLAVVTVPVMIGVLLNYCKPRVAAKIAWCLKPATGVIGAVFISMGIYVYHYALIRVSWRTLVACAVVPLIGYTLGILAGVIFHQGRKKTITISLETGFQNLALALMILETSLEQPASDLAGVVPICYTFLSALYPVAAFLGRMVIQLHKKLHGRLETFDLESSGDATQEETVTTNGSSFTDVRTAEERIVNEKLGHDNVGFNQADGAMRNGTANSRRRRHGPQDLKTVSAIVDGSPGNANTGLLQETGSAEPIV